MKKLQTDLTWVQKLTFDFFVSRFLSHRSAQAFSSLSHTQINSIITWTFVVLRLTPIVCVFVALGGDRWREG